MIFLTYNVLCSLNEQSKKSINFKKIYLFDLDGLIFNKKNNMNLAWNSVRKELGIKVKFKEYFTKIGIPFKDILIKLKIDKKYFKKAEEIFIKSSKKNFNKLLLYKNVPEIINSLKKKNKIIGILTSKYKIRTLTILKKFNLKFDFFLSPVSKKLSKPNPHQIFQIIKKYKAQKKDLVFVVDTDIDKLTSNNVGIDFIYCNYSYKKKILKNIQYQHSLKF